MFERASGVILSLVGMFGCTEPDELELPDKTFFGDHVEFGTDQPDQVCAGTLDTLDARAGELWGLLGAERGPVDYYLLGDVSTCGRG